MFLVEKYSEGYAIREGDILQYQNSASCYPKQGTRSGTNSNYIKYLISISSLSYLLANSYFYIFNLISMFALI